MLKDSVFDKYTSTYNKTYNTDKTLSSTEKKFVDNVNFIIYNKIPDIVKSILNKEKKEKTKTIISANIYNEFLALWTEGLSIGEKEADKELNSISNFSSTNELAEFEEKNIYETANEKINQDLRRKRTEWTKNRDKQQSTKNILKVARTAYKEKQKNLEQGVTLDQELNPGFFDYYLSLRNTKLAQDISDRQYEDIKDHINKYKENQKKYLINKDTVKDFRERTLINNIRRTLINNNISKLKGEDFNVSQDIFELSKNPRSVLTEQLSVLRSEKIKYKKELRLNTNKANIKLLNSKLNEKIKEVEDYEKALDVKNQFNKRQKMMEIFKERNSTRATKYAVTELSHAYNMGRLKVYLQRGVEFVKLNLDKEHIARLVSCDKCKLRLTGGINYSNVYRLSEILENRELQPAFHPYCLCYYEPINPITDLITYPFLATLLAGGSAAANLVSFFQTTKVGDLDNWAIAAGGVLGTAALYYALRKAYGRKAISKNVIKLLDQMPDKPRPIVRDLDLPDLEIPKLEPKTVKGSVDLPTLAPAKNVEENIPLPELQKPIVLENLNKLEFQKVLSQSYAIYNEILEIEDKTQERLNLKKQTPQEQFEEIKVPLNEIKSSVDSDLDKIIVQYASILTRNNNLTENKLTPFFINKTFKDYKNDFSVFSQILKYKENFDLSNSENIKFLSNAIQNYNIEIKDDLDQLKNLTDSLNNILIKRKSDIRSLIKEKPSLSKVIESETKLKPIYNLLKEIEKYKNELNIADNKLQDVNQEIIKNHFQVVTNYQKELVNQQWLIKADKALKVAEIQNNGDLSRLIDNSIDNYTDMLKSNKQITYQDYEYYTKEIEKLKKAIKNYEGLELGKTKTVSKINNINLFLQQNSKLNISSTKLKSFEDLSKIYLDNYENLLKAKSKVREFETLLNQMKDETPKLQDKINDTNKITEYYLAKKKVIPTKKYVLDNLTNLQIEINKVLEGKETLTRLNKQRVIAVLSETQDEYRELLNLGIQDLNRNLSVNDVWERLMNNPQKRRLLEKGLNKLEVKINNIRTVEFMLKNNIISFNN